MAKLSVTSRLFTRGRSFYRVLTLAPVWGDALLIRHWGSPSHAAKAVVWNDRPAKIADKLAAVLQERRGGGYEERAELGDGCLLSPLEILHANVWLVAEMGPGERARVRAYLRMHAAPDAGMQAMLDRCFTGEAPAGPEMLQAAFTPGIPVPDAIAPIAPAPAAPAPAEPAMDDFGAWA